MIEKIKSRLNEIKEENRKRKEECARIERERIQAEKDVLMALSEKKLLVEVIMTLRGYNTRLNSIEAAQNDLSSRVESLEFRANSLESDKSN